MPDKDEKPLDQPKWAKVEPDDWDSEVKRVCGDWKVTGDLYRLRGECPVCGHSDAIDTSFHAETLLEVELADQVVIEGEAHLVADVDLMPKFPLLHHQRSTTGWAFAECDCTGTHGKPDGEHGCGRRGLVSVQVNR